ncbi:hypothetical protein PUNSTDRAFT_131580 [Punctularia strigosozonata HHB-11173 SS5]|uniref:uncharacterized protein n=1 Tax=Punctularia strigosozonata (strain HHB-11173) TaxID=741275 RepID=UPI00044181EC|nr:uncharacterized protein PUNSTDRAFT_131580 [Punctularia strigosozonata HHB-11173 SS5]EIN11415.1 hypothetical protein PUNSTDRAFT_131580 [Punctularia strigosozonata HHB-11173 SS5]
MLSRFSPFVNAKLVTSKASVYASASGSYLRSYPGTLFLCLAWFVYTAFMLFLLDNISQMKSNDKLIFGWRKETCAEHLTTWFFQAHTQITGAHLARLAISALQNPSTAPRTWTELFWLADRGWQGPMGMGDAYFTMIRRRIRPSATFILFSLACGLSLSTPSVITRAWPQGNIDTLVNKTVIVEAISPHNINNLGALEQIATGEASWTSGFSIFDVYNTSIFMAEDRSSGSVDRTLGNVFLGTDTYGMEIPTIPGIWFDGRCEPVTNAIPPFPAIYSHTIALEQWCFALGMRGFQKPAQLSPPSGLPANIVVEIDWCSDWYADWETNSGWINQNVAQANVVAHVMSYDKNGGTDSSGYINCTGSIATGTAALHGERQTYSQFRPHPYFDINMEHDEIPWHPLVAAFASITQYFGGSETDYERYDSILRMLGYQAQVTQDDATGTNSQQYQQVNVSTLADQMWVGATHMTAALATLSRDHVSVGAIQHISVSGRRRNPVFIYLAIGMIGSWMLILIFCTIRMHRPTFSGSLNAYSAARLLAEWPELVDEHSCGSLSDNVNLRAAFGRVEDTLPYEEVGHVGVTHTIGEEMHRLDRKRAYR